MSYSVLTKSSIQQFLDLKEKHYGKFRALTERVFEIDEALTFKVSSYMEAKLTEEREQLLRELDKVASQIHAFWKIVYSKIQIRYPYKLDILKVLAEKMSPDEVADILRDKGEYFD